MKRGIALAIAAGSGAFLSVRVEAANTQATGFIDLHAGYGSNPFFGIQSLGASPTVGATGNINVVRTTSRTRTELTGRVDFDRYVKHYGSTKNYTATLRHNQQFSQFLSVSGRVTYENVINAAPSYSTRAADLGPQGDLLTVGQRTQRISGGIDTTWEPNERNLFQAGINGSHATFSGGNANAYDQYGVGLGYLRTLNAHTKLGVQGGVSFVRSVGNPDSKSYSIGLQWIQEINAIWHLEAGASLIAQAIGGRTFKTNGFNATLCGTYPRITLCFVGSRSSAASGLGGLRTDTQGGVRLNYKLTPRSTLDGAVTYDVSAATGGSIAIPAQKYYDASLAYRRTITPRLSVGATGRAQRRDYGTLFSPDGSKVNAYSATLNLVWRFGQTS